ncbi:hypothetical protein [Sorangium sp. So ce1000]|uniref:hypothetical protein n=1 Tax=Sorangium sp. So ce1000 TaxID=3133325 RepID=UPI003F5DBC76
MKQLVLKDEYRLKARIQPALILMLPAAFATGVAVAGFSTGWALLLRVTSGTLVTLATNMGLVMLLEQIVRQEGKRKEASLWASWNGAPATRLLRHRESDLSTPVQRRRIHQKLKELVPGVQIPTKAKEDKDPKAADDVYEECVRYLRNATRDESQFPLIFKENIHYGFARNLWAMRPLGVAVAAAGTVATAWLTWTARLKGDPFWVADGVIVAIEAMLFAWWTFRVTPSWVFIPARAYADRLFDACDSLKAAEPASAPTAKSN